MDTSCARTNTLLLCRGMCKRLLPILIGLARLKTLDGPKHDFSLECLSIAIYFFEMSVLFVTGELNAYVYDGGGLYQRKYVRTESKGRQRPSLSRTESFSCA